MVRKTTRTLDRVIDGAARRNRRRLARQRLLIGRLLRALAPLRSAGSGGR